MSRAMSRLFFAALGAGLLFAGAIPARAASISYTDSACSSFAVTGSAPNFTLVCSKLACSLAANPGSPLTPLNAATTLSASCSPSGSYAYSWSRAQGNDARCPPAPVSASSSVAISGTGQSASGCVYQVDVNGGANGNGVATVSLDWTANAPPPVSTPTGCVITANDANPLTLPSGGGAVTLKTSCATGSPTTYDWTGGSIAANGSGFNTIATNVTTTTTFTATPRNAGGAGNTASVTVTASPIVVGGGGFCSQYPNVLSITPITWGQAASVISSSQGGLPGNGVWVFQMSVPASAQVSTSTGKFSVAEYQGVPTTRQITISRQACDFRTPDFSGNNGPFTWSNGNSATASFIVVPADQVGFTGGYAGMVAGQTYYINIRNWSIDLNGVSCQSGGQCNAIMNYDPARP